MPITIQDMVAGTSHEFVFGVQSLVSFVCDCLACSRAATAETHGGPACTGSFKSDAGEQTAN